MFQLRRWLVLPLLCAGMAWAADEMPPTLPNQIHVLQGHTETVYAIAFSPDGTLVATGSFDKSAKLWDSATGKELRTFAGTQGHQNLILAVGFSPKGSSLATGGSDNFLKVWDVPTSTPLQVFPQAGSVTAVSLPQDAKTLAAAASDGSIKLYSTADAKQLFNLTGHVGNVTGTTYSPNNQFIASSGVDGTLRYWNPADGKLTSTVGAHSGSVNGVAIHPNSAAAYSVGADGLLKFWQLPQQPDKPLPPHGDAILSMTTSGDGNQVLTSAADKSVRLSNINGQPIRDFAGATTPIQVTALMPNNQIVAGGSAEGRVYFWKSGDGKLEASPMVHAGGVTGIAYRNDNNQFASTGADGLVRLWNLPYAAMKTIAHPDAITALSLRNDASRFVTGSNDKIVRIWRSNDLQLERQFQGHTAPIRAAIVTPNNEVVISASSDQSIRLWNNTNGQPIATLAGHTGGIPALAMVPQGNQFASGGEDGTVKFWQLPVVAPKIFTHPDAVTNLVLSNDGNMVLTIGNDKQARLWNLANPQPERAYNANGQPITATAIANDNRTVAIAGADKSLSVYRGGDVVKKFMPLEAVVTAVAFSPDGGSLIVGLADNSIRWLTIADAKEVRKLVGHTGAITAISYSPKNDVILSASADKTVRIWNAADGAAKGQINATQPIQVMTISKDATRVAVSSPTKVVEWFTLADQKPIANPITAPSDVKGLSFSPDGTRLAIAGSDNQLRIYGADGKLQEAFVHEGALVGTAFLPDGKRLVSASADKTLKLWTSPFLGQGAHTGPVRQLVFTPGGDRLLSVGDDGQLRIWDTQKHTALNAIAAHTGSIVAVAVNSDASQIVTAGVDKTVKVWAAADGKLLRTITLPVAPTAMAFSLNGTRLAVAMTEPTGHRVKAYDAVSGQELMTALEPTAPVSSLAFLPDQRTIVVAGADKLLSLVDVPIVGVLPGHVGGAKFVAYHPNGSQLLTGGNDKFARLWDIGMLKEIKAFGPYPDAVLGGQFSRDGNAIAIGTGKLAKVITPADAKEIANLTHGGEVLSVGFNPDRTRLVTGTRDNLVRTWEIATGLELQSFIHGAAVPSVAYHPNNQVVLSASADKTAAIHTLSIQRVIAASPMPIHSLAVTANGSHAITGGEDKTVKAWNLGNGNMEREFAGATGPVRAVAVSKNVQVLAAAGTDKIIRLYTFNDGKLLGQITAPGEVKALAFSTNNNTLAVACADQTVAGYNVIYQPGQPTPPDFGSLLQSFAHPGGALAVTFNETGTLYSGGVDKQAKAWKIALDQPTRSFQHPALVDAVSFDPSGLFVASGAHDGILRIHDIEKNSVAKAINAHTMPIPAPIYAVLWTADGKQILTCSFDASMKLWDAASGNLVREFKKYDEKTFPQGHQEAIFTAAFSPDGQFVASGSSDRTLKLWKVADATLVRDFNNPKLKSLPPPQPPFAHPGWIYGVRFTPDGQTLISAGSAPRQQGYLASWRVGDGQIVTEAELPCGPVYCLAMDKDGGRIGIACGPRNRLTPTALAYILKTPGK